VYTCIYIWQKSASLCLIAAARGLPAKWTRQRFFYFAKPLSPIPWSRFSGTSHEQLIYNEHASTHAEGVAPKVWVLFSHFANWKKNSLSSIVRGLHVKCTSTFKVDALSIITTSRVALLQKPDNSSIPDDVNSELRYSFLVIWTSLSPRVRVGVKVNPNPNPNLNPNPKPIHIYTYTHTYIYIY